MTSEAHSRESTPDRFTNGDFC